MTAMIRAVVCQLTSSSGDVQSVSQVEETNCCVLSA